MSRVWTHTTPPTQTFRRHLPAWVGLLWMENGSKKHYIGFYVRVGHRSVCWSRDA